MADIKEAQQDFRCTELKSNFCKAKSSTRTFLVSGKNLAFNISIQLLYDLDGPG